MKMCSLTCMAPGVRRAAGIDSPQYAVDAKECIQDIRAIWELRALVVAGGTTKRNPVPSGQHPINKENSRHQGRHSLREAPLLLALPTGNPAIHAGTTHRKPRHSCRRCI